jgi:soluble lytic murein transglycosylase
VVVEELTYYTFKDEAGVTHLTDAPVDPRYRMMTVQITISSGLAPFRKLTLDRLRPVIVRAAAKYRLDPALIAAIIKAESAFDPKAVSWAGARGLMQLMPNTARQMEVTDSFDPEQNIMGGSRYLREMLNRFGGDLTLAIAAYNCGPERVARAGRVPDIAETRGYVRTVRANLQMMGPLFTVGEASGESAAPPPGPSTYVTYPDPRSLDTGPDALMDTGSGSLPGTAP